MRATAALIFNFLSISTVHVFIQNKQVKYFININKIFTNRTKSITSMKTFKYSYPLFKLLKGLQIVLGFFSDYIPARWNRDRLKLGMVSTLYRSSTRLNRPSLPWQ